MKDNKKTLEKIKEARKKESARIRTLDCFDEISETFNLEYVLAKELQDARRNAKLTQADLAERMGTTQSVISRIEHGYNVSINTLEKYARACGKRVELSVV